MASGHTLPANGFIGLLTQADPFGYHLKRIAYQAAANNGLFPVFDEPRIVAAFDLWRETVVHWQAILDAPTHDKVSHIKMAGALLWSFIQEVCCPVDDVVPLRAAVHDDQLKRHGVQPVIRELTPDAGKIMRASPNPSIGFIFTAMIFNSIQRARGLTRAGIDFDDPPMTKHYFHNLCCWYMVSQNPSKEDLYMLFKTMDLYALNLPVSDVLPLRG